MKISRNYRVCEDSLRWILNYRYMIRRQNACDDRHNDGSFRWTVEQSKIIDSLGFNHWLDHTDGPRGYSHFWGYKKK